MIYNLQTREPGKLLILINPSPLQVQDLRTRGYGDTDVNHGV